MRDRWIRGSIATLLSFLFVLAAWTLLGAAQNDLSSWRMVGQVGGPTQAVAAQGNTAYVGVGLRLVVLDVSNPVTPTEVGSTTPFPYFVEDVVVSDTLAYVAAGGAGLRVVNISDPTHPVEIGKWDSPGYAEGVAVAGSTVYLADGPYGLWVVDVSDPAQPQKVGSAYDMNYTFEVAVSGHYAYIAAAGAGLLIADVSDPAHPVEVASLDTPGYAYGVAISGTLSYIADAWEGLRVVNVSDPAHPVEMGACDTAGWALNVAVAGATAYVADGANGLRIINLPDPTHPAEVGAYEVYGLARRVAVAGGTAYIADLRGGLRAVDVADPSHPAQVGLYSPMTDARRVAVDGSYAYVAAGFSGLRVVDVHDPQHPIEVAVYETDPGYAEAVVISGTYAYVATSVYGPYDLHVVDISDPGHPTRVAAIDAPGVFRDIAVQGQIIYAADEWGLRLISVSDPTAPTELGFIPGKDQPTVGVAVSGTLAYVANSADKVKIVDVSNPYSPTLISVCCSNWHFVTGVAVSGDTLYVAVHSAGLHIADVSDPHLPVEIGFYDTPGTAASVTVSGTEVYVGDMGGGVSVVDVSNPFSPTLATTHDTAGLTWHTGLAGNYAYVADGHGGLLILERTAGSTVIGLKEPLSTEPTNWSVGGDTRLPGLATWIPRTNRVVTSVPSDPTVPRFTPTRQDAGDIVSESPVLTGTVLVVTSTWDSGPGSLRQTLLDAGPGDTITFDPAVFPPANPVTITLRSELPPVTQGHLTIDASNAGIVIDGGNLEGYVDGLEVHSSHNVIRGLQIVNFSHCGLDVGSSHNVIEGNVLGGNECGIRVGGEGEYSIIIGNLVGINAQGSVISNRFGIAVCSTAKNNRVGGTAPGERNVVSGNRELGVSLANRDVVGNVVVGNYIGTDVTGTKAIGNGRGGVFMWDGACGNTVEGNLISGSETGVVLSGPDANHNEVIGNLIGTDATGTTAVGNTLGVSLCGAGYTRVEGNVISGNSGGGIAVCEWGIPHSLIMGNYIGTDATGTRPLGNASGISLNGWHVLVGGATLAERNVIGGSQGAGIVASAGTEYNWIAGNSIGTDASGVISLGNGWGGVVIEDHSAHNFVQGNTIAYNGGAGVYDAGVYVRQSPYNTIRRNAIYGHAWGGIRLDEGGNKLLSKPVILTVTETGVAGTACPGCTVEVFSDAEDEGRVYEGSAIADTSGRFTFTKASGLTGPYVTATATDRDGNTSEFSAPQRVWWKQIYLPVILKGQ